MENKYRNSIWPLLDTRQPGTDVSRLTVPGSPQSSNDFKGKACSNVLKVFDICLQLPSDSEKKFGFLVDEFSELVHTRKSRCLRHFCTCHRLPRGGGLRLCGNFATN